MNIVTKLTPTIKEGRMNVYLDNKYSFTVDADLITNYGIRAGITLEEDTIIKLKQEDLYKKFANRILSKSLSRPHSMEEIRRYGSRLIHKLSAENNYLQAGDWIDRVIEDLVAQNILNDKSFVDWMVELKSDKYSKYELKNKLRARGVKTDIIDNSTVLMDVDDSEKIKNLIDKKKRQLEYKKFSEDILKRKVTEFLIRKGYKYQQINEAYNS